MDGPVADNALLADLFPAGFELGLDQAYHLRPRPQDLQGGRQDPGQGDKGNIHRCEIRLFRGSGGRVCLQILRLHVAEVGLLHADDTRICPQLPVQLAVAHINGVDFGGPVLQHAVCKASGGGADIHAELSLQIDGKSPQGFLQLQAAPAHIGEGLAPHLDLRGLRVKGSAGFVLLLAVHIYNSCHNQGFGLFPGRSESLLGH